MATRPTDLLDRTLGEIVTAQPQAAALFERLRLDFCCGGRRTLDEACAQQGLDAATVTVLLAALDDEAGAEPPEAHDVSRASISELCDHIVVSHHQPLRTAMTRIAELLATVVRVHGAAHPDLADLERLFTATRRELEGHLAVEESELFPACRALDAGRADAFDASLLALLEDDHAGTGDALGALRELAGDYDGGRALCSTHRRLLDALHAFELDLHQHVHEENNVLFPRVAAAAAAA